MTDAIEPENLILLMQFSADEGSRKPSARAFLTRTDTGTYRVDRIERPGEFNAEGNVVRWKNQGLASALRATFTVGHGEHWYLGYSWEYYVQRYLNRYFREANRD